MGSSSDGEYQSPTGGGDNMNLSLEDDLPLGGQQSPPLDDPQDDDLTRTTQAVLQNACKRRKLSSSGKKGILATRLIGAGFKSISQVRRLSEEFIASGVDISALSNVRSKAPNWTKHETARLCHVINHPSNSTILVQLYNKPPSRAVLDKTRHDPWANQFADLFNDTSFVAVAPEPHDGVTTDILAQFKPNVHPETRDGAMLKSRWNKIRSLYTVAREKFSRSGQGDADVFNDYTDGDPSLAYVHCVFFKSPALEYVVRVIPVDAQVDQGIGDQDTYAALDITRPNRRKLSRSADISYQLGAIAKSLEAPVHITSGDDPFLTADTRSKLQEYETTSKMADTVEKLMGLENKLLTRIKEADGNNNIQFSVMLKERLEIIRTRIDKALEQ